MNRLLLVDGHNLLFQMFFGMPARIVDRDGKAIQGVVGFVGALLRIIKMSDPTHVAVLFDGEHENPRAEIDQDYKANREDYSAVEQERNPFSQLPDIYRALDILSIKHTEIEDGETDDAIAAYVFKYKADAHITVSSFDSDFFQLIDENVTVLRYRGDKSVTCDVDYIREKLGILPSQYADFKSLTGDAADNIKGARGIGKKTAAALLSEFGTLGSILEGSDRIKKPSVKRSVEESRDRLLRNRRLIALNAQAALPFSLDELKYLPSGLSSSEVLKMIRKTE